MGMLTKAENKMAYAKVGIYGSAGSGKTFTASCIAVGLHKFCKATKAVGFFDTEPALSYVLPLFKAAGIEVFCYDKSRALQDLMSFMEEAEKECSVIIIDSITHIWRDAQESYIKKLNESRKQYGKRPITKLEFHHWGPIKEVWGRFTDKFTSSKAHVIVCGRMGSIYEYQTNEEGKKELVTNGNKMATEKEMGYEPSLLIEMEKLRENEKIINRAIVEKDRSNQLNGQTIDFPNFKGSDLNCIMNVFEKLSKHFDNLNIGGEHFDSMNQRNSSDMYEIGEDGSEWPNEQRQRAIWSEEIQGLLAKYYPAQTAEDKKQRQELLERFFATRSWTKVESTNSNLLKEGYRDLRIHLIEKFEQPGTTFTLPFEREGDVKNMEIFFKSPRKGMIFSKKYITGTIGIDKAKELGYIEVSINDIPKNNDDFRIIDDPENFEKHIGEPLGVFDPEQIKESEMTITIPLPDPGVEVKVTRNAPSPMDAIKEILRNKPGMIREEDRKVPAEYLDENIKKGNAELSDSKW